MRSNIVVSRSEDALPCCLYKFEFNFLNGNLLVRVSHLLNWLADSKGITRWDFERRFCCASAFLSFLEPLAECRRRAADPSSKWIPPGQNLCPRIGSPAK